MVHETKSRLVLIPMPRVLSKNMRNTYSLSIKLEEKCNLIGTSTDKHEHLYRPNISITVVAEKKKCWNRSTRMIFVYNVSGYISQYDNRKTDGCCYKKRVSSLVGK